MIRLVVVAALLLVGGCAAKVTSSADQTPIPVYADAKTTLVVLFKADAKVQANEKWPLLKSKWLEALRTRGQAKGLQVLTERPKTPATLATIEVTNFRYMSSGLRYSVGVMAGNAWISAQVRYQDATSGETLATRNYDTSSSAWEGVFSAMTSDQIKALATTIIDDVTINSSGKPRRSPL